MPIQFSYNAGMIVTSLTGRVTDDELLDYYKCTDFNQVAKPWRELIDARGVTDMAVTVQGQWKLAAYVLTRSAELSGGKVGMVAGNDMMYGMFRMWEGQRSDMDYEVRVFRDLGYAMAWLTDQR
ncbi:MAG: hypothetical protein HUU02_00275 [Bacteroidetes bacterium]|nr:hypothetical protein [Bacteroidota bacterium]